VSAPHPTAIRTIDLERAITPIEDVAEFRRTRVFVSDGGELIGSVDIDNTFAPISAARLSDAIAAGLWYQITRRKTLARPAPTERPALRSDVGVSVVIPTCQRPDDLRRCLESLEAQRRTRPLEVIVIDNRPGPASPTTAVVRQFERVILLEEHKPGLSYARNAGFAAASGAIIAAIDDDVTVPAGWLERLVAPFVRPEVMAVTGHVLPVELDTPSQCLFEAYGGLGKGFQAFERDGEWFRSRRVAVPTWLLGATANAAFRASIFSDPRIGMLDEALGAGMPTGCSEDTYLFYRILKAGGTIAYEPGAWVWHRHRRDLEALRRQIFAYSKGHIAYHLTTLLRDGDGRALIRFFYSLPRTYLSRAWYRLRGHSDYPLSLIALEIAGCMAGPWALWQARRRVRRLGPGARRPVVNGTVREAQLSAAGMARPA
jgi:GT2 family glycosyltransferase